MLQKILLTTITAALLMLISLQITSARAVYDFDGDGKTDPVLWRANEDRTQLVWYISGSRDGFMAIQWGAISPTIAFDDRSVPEDYDGDGKWDVAVWRRLV